MEREVSLSNQLNNVFIITRPIQFINILNIPLSNKFGKVLLVVNTFNGTCELILNQKQYKIWNDIVCFDSVYSALRWVVQNKKFIKSLYTFSDNGIRLHYFFNQLKNIDIYLYEEGAATYINKFNPFSLTSFILKLYSQNLGIKHIIGTYPRLKGIYVYRPKVFKTLKPYVKSPVYSFKKPFEKHLNECQYIDLFTNGLQLNSFNKNVVLYLTGWNFNANILNLKNNPDYTDYIFLIKPHPHFKLDDNRFLFFDSVIDSKILAEIIIDKLLQQTNDFLVVHENSTSIFNFINNPKFKHLNLGDFDDNDWYTSITDELKNKI